MSAVPQPAHVVEDQTEVFDFIGDPETHGGVPVTRIDTHAAVVFLAGADAYKIKRAVRFAFLDFSTLARRRAACEAELAVNHDNAPEIYLGVLPVSRRNGRLTLGPGGEVAEWAVHMRRFDVNDTLDRVTARGGLDDALVARLVQAVSAAHARAPRRAPDPALASLSRYLDETRDAFAEGPDLFPPSRADALAEAGREALARARELLRERGRLGFVRRCHGDLHLGNIVLIEGRPRLFDAIEFDDAVATGDVLYDLAFLLMDLWERGLGSAANLVLNLWLRESREEAHYAGLAALPLFLSLRAAIRAMVTAATLPHLAGAERERGLGRAGRYFDVAERCLRPAPLRLAAVGGLSGAGKSTLGKRLACRLGRAPGAVHLRSDVERKALANVAETERLPPEAYAPAVTDEVYARLRRKARRALGAGQSVVVDAVHGRAEERELVAAVAREHGAHFDGLWLEAPVRTLLDRVERRTGDASDATAAIVRAQTRYDLGSPSWTRLDASGGADETLAAALLALGLEPEGG